MILYLVEKLVIRNSLWNQRNSKVVLFRISNWISTGFPSRTIALLLPKSRISSTSVLDLKEYINETHIHYISYSTMILVLELYIQKFDNIFAIVCLHKFLYWIMCRIPKFSGTLNSGMVTPKSSDIGVTIKHENLTYYVFSDIFVH